MKCFDFGEECGDIKCGVFDGGGGGEGAGLAGLKYFDFGEECGDIECEVFDGE